MTLERNTPALRALIVVRLSRVTDDTTSPERQRSEAERVCNERGWTVVGVAEDLDVSGGKSPWDRPALASWLDRPEDYDVIVFFRLDRLVRSVAHLWKMVEWSEDHGVTLVSATEPHFDLSDRFGRLIVALVATVAELELDGIRERTVRRTNTCTSPGSTPEVFHRGVCSQSRPTTVGGSCMILYRSR